MLAISGLEKMRIYKMNPLSAICVSEEYDLEGKDPACVLRKAASGDVAILLILSLLVVPCFLLGSLMMLFLLFSIELSETVRLFLFSTLRLVSERE